MIQLRWCLGRSVLVFCVLCAGILLFGCGKGDTERFDRVTEEDVETPEQRPLALNSPRGCAIDDDCADGLFCFQRACAMVCASDDDCAGGTCSNRGRCTTGSSETRVKHTLADLRVESFPDTVRVISADDATVTFEFGLNKAMPPEGIAYRIARSDGLGEPERVRHATGSDSFRITVDTGRARPGQSTAAVPVAMTLFSSVGNFELLLEPRPSFEGTWAGAMTVDNLGGAQKLDLTAYILGSSPDNLSMVLPVGAGHFFSPRDDHNAQRNFERAPITFNSQLNVYQALFVHEYRFEGGLFGDLRARQVERTLRFDFNAAALEAGRLEGRATDQWRGLFDNQRSSGTREVGVVRYDGDFSLTFADVLPRSASSYTTSEPVVAQPALIERGALHGCSAESFSVAAVDTGLETWSCDGISSVQDFKSASPENRALCALTVSRRVVDGETTADQLASFFASEGGPDGLSFEQFLQACADDEDDTCQPSEEALCAYQLVAYAAHDVYRLNLNNNGERADELLSWLMIELTEMASEAFVARQLGAFYTDIALRRQWLRNATAPTLFLNAVESANKDLMQEWTQQVLNVQEEIFFEFFTQDVFTFLGRPASGAEASERRTRLLTEASTMWRGYAEGLMLAASRWNEVVRNTAERQAHAERLQQQALELYLVMGMIGDFSRASGSASTTASLANNFGQLIEMIDRLNTSFDDSVYARDAEVVVARSLNPLSDNNSLLSERRDHAQATVLAARLAIEDILDEVTIEALQEADLRARVNNERRSSANRIAEICGLPPGCTENDLLVRSECLVVELGQCGLLRYANPEIGAEFDPTMVAASEAGRAVLSVLEAYHNVAIQNDELHSFLFKLELQYAELEAFKDDVENWNQMRLAGVEDLRQSLAQRNRVRDARIREMLDNFDDRAQVRGEQINAMQQRFSQWDTIRRDSVETTYRQMLDELSTHREANRLENAGLKASAALDAAAESLPKTVGTSKDVKAVQRASLMFAANVTALGASYTADMMRLQAERQATARQRTEGLVDASLAEMSERAQLEDAIRDQEMAELEEAALLSNQLTEDELAIIQEALELMREQRAAELAYSRDMSEFRTRRNAYLQEMVDVSGRILRVEQSHFNVLQRMLEYNHLVQKARLEAARLQELDRQLIDLENLVGGIGAVFSRTYALERAENYLDGARSALMDWLVVIEYYAVRPFIEQRIQILLARNAYQLEAVAEKLRQLENTCGGSERSKATATLSLRHQVLGLNRAQKSATTEDVLSADERFRRWLSQSYVPVDRRIRFSTSESLSQVLDRTDGVMAATFTLGLNDFANLNLACNAKIESVAIQLVGELGSHQPTATVLYDGTSQLRSCQPNIAEYVRAHALGRTAYDTITQLRTAGRAMSPLAGVNEFLDANQSVNRTLAGLPVASEYTLLISTTTGDNAHLDWSKLEDVLIRVEYSYQDLFAEACD